MLVATSPAAPASVQTSSSSSSASSERSGAIFTNIGTGPVGVAAPGLVHQRAHQLAEGRGVLQRPQAGGVRAGDVDGDVVGVAGAAAGTRSGSPPSRRPAGWSWSCRWRRPAASRRRRCPGRRRPRPAARASAAAPALLKPIRLMMARCSRQPEQPRLGVARLALAGHGAQLGEAEAQRAPGPEAQPVLVQAGGDARPGRGSRCRPPGPGSRCRASSAASAPRAARLLPHPVQRRQRGVVHLLGVAAAGAEQHRAQQPAVAAVQQPARAHRAPVTGPRGPAAQDCSERTPTSPAMTASMPCTAAASPCTVVMQGTLRSTAAVRIS